MCLQLRFPSPPPTFLDPHLCYLPKTRSRNLSRNCN